MKLKPTRNGYQTKSFYYRKQISGEESLYFTSNYWTISKLSGIMSSKIIISEYYTILWHHIAALIERFERRFDEVGKHNISGIEFASKIDSFLPDSLIQ